MRHESSATIWYRPVSQQELDLIAAAQWLAFPSCSFGSGIFYSELSEEHVAHLVRDQHEGYRGLGYVVRFALEAEYAAQFSVQRAGKNQYEAVWVPAEELAEFNQHILGQIGVVSVFSAQ